MTVLSKRKMELIKRMEEAAKPKRELADINAEFTQLCQQAGDLQYRILCFKGDLEQINQRILVLNKEAAQLKEQHGKTSISPEAGTDSSEPGSPAGEASVLASVSEHPSSVEHREDA